MQLTFCWGLRTCELNRLPWSCGPSRSWWQKEERLDDRTPQRFPHHRKPDPQTSSSSEKSQEIYVILETYQAMLWYSSESIIFKNSKIALLEYFSTGTKIVGNHSKFYLSLMKTSGKHPVHFWLVSLHGAINHSGTPLILKLRSPSIYQGVICPI